MNDQLEHQGQFSRAVPPLPGAFQSPRPPGRNTLATSFAGLVLPDVRPYFKVSDDDAWHRTNEYLPMERAVSMSLLPGLIATLEARRRIWGSTDLVDLSTLEVSREGNLRPTATSPVSLFATPIAQVNPTLNPRVVTLQWNFHDDELCTHSSAAQQTILNEVGREVLGYRVQGFGAGRHCIPIREGVLHGQEYLSILTEMLGGRYAAVPLLSSSRAHGGELQRGFSWFLIDQGELDQKLPPPPHSQEPLVRIHALLWDAATDHLRSLGDAWVEAFFSLARTYKLDCGICRYGEISSLKHDQTMVWLSSPTSTAPDGTPLTLTCMTERTSAGRQKIDLRWLHHTEFAR
jgi:hypothetical protein